MPLNAHGRTEREILKKSATELLSHPWRIHTYAMLGHVRFLIDLARGYSYSDAYTRRQGRRSARNPEFTIGGWDGESGKQQLEFLRERGLDPGDTLFDIGCGNLRAGRFFIDHLNEGRYHGMEISPSLLADGMERLGPAVLLQKRPALVVSGSLSFEWLPDADIDMAIAHSVLTHMPIEHVADVLDNLHRVLVPGGRFYGTIFPAEGPTEQLSPTSWAISETRVGEIASDAGFAVEFISEQKYPHSGGQQMIEFTRR